MDFQKPYQRQSFLDFLKEFLPDDFVIGHDEVNLHRKFSKIKQVIRLGEVKSIEAGGQPLKIYEVEHESESDPRVTLTREFFDMMRQELTTRALIIFSSKKSQNYRFSLMTVDFTLDGKKVQKDFSNPRRYSFYLGPEAKIYTPTKYLTKKGKVKDLNDIVSRFDIEVVTQEFYHEISNWYFWAVKNVNFPKDTEEQNNGRNIAVIRLITRLIFIWFMKQKKLVPGYLFEQQKVNGLLNDLSREGDSYYKAILQNLFFATLNTPIKDRRFRNKESYRKGFNPDYGDKSIYRYEENFKNPSEISGLFKDIPFLNGGLFECLDRKEDKIIIDGFTRVKKNQPKVPNFLFFDEDQAVDLNQEYGTKNKNYKVRGLLHILNTYNFTIDESTPVDIEISLDPELLGRVFENLLASYNPETATTARKATGSYYTPRPIVDYMVDESLKEYFKTKLSDAKGIEQKVKDLLSYNTGDNPFTPQETKILINAIYDLKVIDPAVGSGAFPMGILQKLVLILSKLDLHNKIWKQEQVKAIDKNVTDAVLKNKLKQKIEENFKNNELDYGRKLYLIQNCIYGVDIQPIAIQIAKLRFFISLLVDEKVDESQDNFGIEPLPNLETKFVAANSLIGLSGQMVMKSKGITDLENQLKDVRMKYFNANYKEEKEKLRHEDQELRLQIAEEFKKIGFQADDTKKIVSWDPYDANTFADWFDPEWMFGIKDGFDIVIANPPYGFRDVLTAEDKKYFREEEGIEFKSGDSAELFCKKCFDNLVKTNGFLTFIIPKKSLYGDAWEGLRKQYWRQYFLYFLLDSSKAFENVLLEQSCFGLGKKEQNKDIKLGYLDKDKIINLEPKEKSKIFMDNGTVQIYKELYPDIFEKIKKNKTSEILVQGDLGLAIGTDFFSDKPTKYKLLKGIDIDRWRIKQNRYLKNEDKLKKEELNKFLKPKIICQRLVAHIENPKPHIKITACYDDEGIIITNTLTTFRIDPRINDKFWLAYLNSIFVNWYTYNFIYSRAVRTMDFYNFYIQQIPIPKSIIEDTIKQKLFINLVDKILNITKSSDYLQNKTKQEKVRECEKQIDGMVYHLYGLTEKEIKIIEFNNKYESDKADN